MAVLFSAVTLSANDQEVEFFVGGIPREYDDLEGWTAFEDFMEDLDKKRKYPFTQKRISTAKKKHTRLLPRK